MRIKSKIEFTNSWKHAIDIDVINKFRFLFHSFLKQIVKISFSLPFNNFEPKIQYKTAMNIVQKPLCILNGCYVVSVADSVRTSMSLIVLSHSLFLYCLTTSHWGKNRKMLPKNKIAPQRLDIIYFLFER